MDQARIVKGRHRFETDWTTTDEGLLDLRGVKSGRDGFQFRFITLSRADFRRARGRLKFFESELSDCLFDSVSLTGQPRFDRGFVRCSFRGASLKGLSKRHWHRWRATNDGLSYRATKITSPLVP
ncbi:hypothetical protein MUN78_02920 [Leucobacter allii]|uniref:Pentapeptide repeat-containing protein n=1 Tax=Leucobacter allii TaxID=2932247 RepID=A0ABY4FNE9_9MICO|nr:hypothetical protein [Leucobacter allii]UOQ57805.1 hypothetical protein MUN78_02920 [Leucobacter allii]